MKAARLFPLLLLALAALALPASVQAADFSLYGSFWDSDDLAEAWGGGIRVGFPVGERLVIDISGHYFEDFSDKFTDDDSSGIEVSTLPFDFGAVWYFGPDDTGFLVGGGATYAYMDVNDIQGPGGVEPNVFRGEADDEFGWYAKVGYQFGAGWMAEVMYRDLDISIENIELVSGPGFIEFPRQIDLDMAGFQVNFGYRF